MNTPVDFFPFSLLVACAVLWVVVLVWALTQVSWPAMIANRRAQHIFFAATLFVAVVATMRAGILPGLTIHMLAATSITMMMGWPLAVLSLSLAQLVIALAGFESLENLAVNGIFSAVVPVLISFLFFRLVVKPLPHNPFVFIMVGGFFNGAVTIALTACAVSYGFWVSGIYSQEVIWHNYLSYLPLMMFPEGFLNGMFISGMVAFQPQWLSCFDEDSYFNS